MGRLGDLCGYELSATTNNRDSEPLVGIQDLCGYEPSACQALRAFWEPVR